MGRLIIRPGLRVLPRGEQQVQIGLRPHRAVVLDLDPDVRRTLDALTIGVPTSASDDPVVAALREHDAVVDSDLIQPRETAFEMIVFGELPALDLAPPHSDLALVIGVGEVERTLVDALVQADRPHLVVRFVDGDALIGPFVVPGETACVRCVDAHHTDEDRRWPLLVQSHLGAGRRDGVDDRPSPALVQWASRWAAHEIAVFEQGRDPLTMGATITICGETGRINVVHWAVHPDCGCGWSATMEA